jgi:hypothetical protein
MMNSEFEQKSPNSPQETKGSKSAKSDKFQEDIMVPYLQDAQQHAKKEIGKGLKTRKRQMIKALVKHLGIVSPAAKEIRMDRDTHYKWLKEDPKYKQAVEDIIELKVDVLERAFVGLVMQGDRHAIVHGLKTLGRSRGYGEHIQVKQDGKIDTKLELVIKNANGNNASDEGASEQQKND